MYVAHCSRHISAALRFHDRFACAPAQSSACSDLTTIDVSQVDADISSSKVLQGYKRKVLDVQLSIRGSTSVLVSQAATNHLSGHVAPQEA